VHGRFLVHKVALGQVLSREIRFSIVSIVPSMLLTLSIIYTLLLPKGQKGNVWESSQKQYSFGTWGALDRRELTAFFKINFSPQNTSATVDVLT
jgi:hypothetical protein